jgi:hypothetical protein
MLDISPKICHNIYSNTSETYKKGVKKSLKKSKTTHLLFFTKKIMTNTNTQFRVQHVFNTSNDATTFTFDNAGYYDTLAEAKKEAESLALSIHADEKRVIYCENTVIVEEVLRDADGDEIEVSEVHSIDIADSDEEIALLFQKFLNTHHADTLSAQICGDRKSVQIEHLGTENDTVLLEIEDAHLTFCDVGSGVLHEIVEKAWEEYIR